MRRLANAWPGGPVDEVVGREQELGLLHEFLEDAKGEPQALLLEGDAGIGKTTLWKAAADDAEGLGFRRLASRPGSGEAQLSFAGPTDLLEPVIDELPGVPPPQRQALEVALLRASSDGPPPEPRAIALAFLGAIRSLAEQRPVLVAVDDVQWLDGPSADALAFAARRFDSMPVALLVARRVGPDQRPASRPSRSRSARRCWPWLPCRTPRCSWSRRGLPPLRRPTSTSWRRSGRTWWRWNGTASGSPIRCWPRRCWRRRVRGGGTPCTAAWRTSSPRRRSGPSTWPWARNGRTPRWRRSWRRPPPRPGIRGPP